MLRKLSAWEQAQIGTCFPMSHIPQSVHLETDVGWYWPNPPWSIPSLLGWPAGLRSIGCEDFLHFRSQFWLCLFLCFGWVCQSWCLQQSQAIVSAMLVLLQPQLLQVQSHIFSFPIKRWQIKKQKKATLPFRTVVTKSLLMILMNQRCAASPSCDGIRTGLRFRMS